MYCAAMELIIMDIDSELSCHFFMIYSDFGMLGIVVSTKWHSIAYCSKKHHGCSSNTSAAPDFKRHCIPFPFQFTSPHLTSPHLTFSWILEGNIQGRSVLDSLPHDIVQLIYMILRAVT
jgi:hypothetical protein